MRCGLILSVLLLGSSLYVHADGLVPVKKPPSKTIPVFQEENLRDILPLYGFAADRQTISKFSAANPGLVLTDGSVKSDGNIQIPSTVQTKEGGQPATHPPSTPRRRGAAPAAGWPTFHAPMAIVVPVPPVEPGAAVASSAESFPAPGTKSFDSGGKSSSLEAGMMIAKIGSYSGVFHDLIVVPSGSETYHLVDEDLQGSTTPGDCKSADGKPFSFDVERIARQYESTSKQIYASPGLAVILEADTGLEEAQFTSAVLWTNPGDLETNYGTDLHGANIFAANGDIRPDATYKFAAHGSQVFNVLASASALPSGALSNAYRIAMAKVTRDQAPFDVNAVAITDSFRYARAINAAVLNLSVVASQSLPGLEDGLRAASFVVVSAAGNNGKDVQSAQVFPPAMNSSRDKLIVVGAHDWVNDWATFSNWGPLVDLLAPGCAVPLSSAGNGVFVYGTSFAAPFVSLTAALLKSLHLTPQNIKNRILASVDFDPRLVYKVKSGGSLNAEDALAFTTDILVLRGANGRPGTRLVGEFGPNDRWECTGDGPNQIFSPSTVTRIVTGYPVQGGSTNFEVAARAHGSPLVSYCKSMSGKVNFRLTSTDAYQPYGWNEIWSVLPRCRAYGGSIQLTC